MFFNEDGRDKFGRDDISFSDSETEFDRNGIPLGVSMDGPNRTVIYNSSSADPSPVVTGGREFVNSNERRTRRRFLPKSCSSCGGFVDRYRNVFVLGAVFFLVVGATLLGLFLSPLNNNNNSNNEQPVATTGTSLVDTNTSALATAMLATPEPSQRPTGIPVLATNTIEIDSTDDESLSTATTMVSPAVLVINSTTTARFELLEVVPHDTDAFTQGLEILSLAKIELMNTGFSSNETDTDWNLFENPLSSSSFVLESTGQYGESTLRIVELASGRVVHQLELSDSYFGEGCTYYSASSLSKVRIVQITWSKGQGFVYELSLPSPVIEDWNLTRIGDFRFSSLTTNGQGWGIVYHPPKNQFIVSDGTEYLHFWDLIEKNVETNTTDDDDSSFDFVLVDKIAVRQQQGDGYSWEGVDKLNELEWDPYSYGGNTILANIFRTNRIVRVWVGSSNGDNANVGKISHVYDLSELKELAQVSNWGAVLNGIAFVYDSTTGSRNTSAPNASSFENDTDDYFITDNEADFSSPEESENQFWVTGKYWPKMYRIRLVDNENLKEDPELLP